MGSSRSQTSAAEGSGIPTDRMLIAATHTHSAPPPGPGLGLRGVEAEDLSENEAKYGEQFVAYCRRVGRYFPAQRAQRVAP